MGPFTSDFAATNSGFLSALIFRAITFNTKFFHEARLRYTDAADFKGVMAHAAKQFRRKTGSRPPPSYFCNTRAYGPHNHGRTVELAQIYGPKLESQNIAAQLKLVQASAIPFTSFWKWLKGSQNGHVRFLHLGPLGSYLLAADYTYTSPRLVDQPTVEELGALICRLNKGAVRGLERLGLIPVRPLNDRGKPTNSTPEACVRGLKTIHSILSSHLSPDVQADVRFDIIMIEHSLCKLSRAIALGKFKL
jgi:hypothetical protein